MTIEGGPTADADATRDATPTGERGEPWGDCEVMLIANRRPGSTHKFYRDWRFEVVMRSGQPLSGATLFTLRLGDWALAASGWRYDMVPLEGRPGSPPHGRTAFSWMATSAAAAPDPLAAAIEQTQAWLTDRGWRQEPSDPACYHKSERRVG